MPSRMSNKDRIARLAAEKAAETKDKEQAKEKKKTARPKAAKKTRSTRTRATATKSAGRLKAVWVVCDQSGTPVKTFPYGEKKAAEADSKKLTADKGKLHFVKMDKIPME